MASEKDILKEARERFESAVEFESENRTAMLDDVRFEAGDQWPNKIKQYRERDPYGPRPCLVLNRVSKHKRNIVNDIRQNRPQIKVLPVDDDADIETAEMLNGLMRHIQVVSEADIAYDIAVDSQVNIGVGYFRVVTRQIDESSNLQEIAIQPIINPFSVYMDIYAEHPAGADSEWCFVVDDVPRETLKKDHPKADPVDWKEAIGDSMLSRWYPAEDTVRIAEYWTIEETSARMLRTEIGEFPEKDFLEMWDGQEIRPQVLSEFSQKKRQAKWRKMLGNQILEETDFPSRYLGIVRLAGEERIIDGRRDFRGLVRDLKDPQRMYNYWASLNTELIALAPKTPWVGPAGAFEGYEDDWAKANNQNFPYLQYNHLDEQGNPMPPPSRADPIRQNTALVQAMMQAADDLREISGQSESSFGEPSNEKSGRAIMARQRESDINNFHFVDNLTRSIRHAGRIILDLIPHIYDTERVVRILGEDESPDFAMIQPGIGRSHVETEDASGKVQRIYDPSIGRYDVRVTAGPSYTTKRQEAFDAMAQILQANPNLWAVMGDLLVRSMDWPGADEMAERLKAMLPPEVKQIIEAEEQGRQDATNQFEMAQQAVMAQVAPIIQELEQALQQAGATLEEKELALQEAQAQLANKAAELTVKAREAELSHASEQAEADAEIVKAVLAMAQGQQEGEARGEADGKIAEALAKLAEASTMLAKRHEESIEDVDALRKQVEANEERRERIMSAMLDYLRGGQAQH